MSQWKASRGWLRIQALCLKLALVIYFNAFNSFECCNNKGWVGEKKEDFEIRNKIGKMSRQRDREESREHSQYFQYQPNPFTGPQPPAGEERP